MTAEQAKEYRIVDWVISAKPTTRPVPEGPCRRRRLKYSFCGKSRNDVCKLIAGPTVHICVEAHRSIQQGSGSV